MDQRSTFHLAYAISFALQLGFLVAASIIGFLLIGLWLDSHLRTQPTFLLLGVAVGITMTIVEVAHYIEPLLRLHPHADH